VSEDTREREYSHAGGVVARIVDGAPQYLLVEANGHPGEWVLPKGHIEPGETAEAAAVREVEEEAGVRAAIVARAGDNEYMAEGERVRTIFFLMRYEGDVGRDEDRGLAWRRYDDALKLLHYENTRQVLAQAHALSETQ
jgi:8-oxo-dGTP pyrophosphatase MutT (NUDIX family)